MGHFQASFGVNPSSFRSRMYSGVLAFPEEVDVFSGLGKLFAMACGFSWFSDNESVCSSAPPGATATNWFYVFAVAATTKVFVAVAPRGQLPQTGYMFSL